MHIDEIAPLLDPTAPPRVMSRTDALRLGWSDDAIRHQLSRGRWRRLLPHTYLTHDTVTWDDRLRAATVFAGEGALLSGAAALCDLGLRSVRRPDRVLVLVPAGRSPRSVLWVQIRPSARPVRAALLPGPPRVTTARAVADLAVTTRRLDDVRALVTEVVREKVCDIAELTQELHHGPQRGSAHLRQAIDEAAGGAWSAPEARAATLLRRAGLPPFKQNVRIDLPDGRWFVVDFLWPALRAVLEIDSLEHHSLPPDADGTSDKHLALETSGYSVIHRAPRVVNLHEAAFVRGVRQWLEGRAAELAGRSA